MSWTRNGNRYKKVRSRGGRFGEPKVHIEVRCPELGRSAWWPICVPDPHQLGMGWEEVSDDEPVTCKSCLRREDTWKKRGT